jgi:GT2 family glycosyltransferase
MDSLTTPEPGRNPPGGLPPRAGPAAGPDAPARPVIGPDEALIDDERLDAEPVDDEIRLDDLERGRPADGDDEDDDSIQVLPPVVAVVVTNDGGAWLDETLTSLAAQDYPSLSVLVLDNGSEVDPTARIAAAMPRAFVRRLGADLGFAGAANATLDSVEGAFFLLFCHDDVVLDRSALSVMVQEAYRSNAAIVGPKLVEHDHPEILLEVGMAVDHYGVPFSGIEPDEVDQEQHDAVRDVFFVSHAAMLVRADLFRELAGFDPATFPGSDDIDLCWRARLAGARVIVAPDARVRHRRATANDVRPARGAPRRDVRAETTSRIRVLCKAYSGLALLWVLPIAFTLGVLEATGLAITGRARRARALLAGWFAAFRQPSELRQARAETQHLRRVDDGDVRELMIRGSARVRSYLVAHLHAGDRLAEVSNRTRARVSEAGVELRRAPAVLAMLLTAVVLIGSRGFIFGDGIAQIGSFREWPGVGALWSTFTSPWRFTMMGAADHATPAFGAMAALSTVLVGKTGFAHALVIAAALPLGTWGVFRLVRPFAASLLPGVVAAVAYAANPLARNAIAQGELGPLVCFAIAPYLLRELVAATTGGRDRVRHAVLKVALLSAISASVWPPAILLVLAMAVAAVAAMPFAGDRPLAFRMLLVAAAGTAIGAVLLLPWIVSLLGADAPTWGFLPRAPLTFGETLRFESGPVGAGVMGWGLFVAAVVPLFIATGTRLAWTIRAWMLAVLSFAGAWLPSRLAPDAAVPAAEGVLVGAALGLAVAIGLGLAAYTDEVRRSHFGWRQVAVVVAAAGLLLPFAGLAIDAVSGRWGLRNGDWPTAFSWMDDDSPPGGFRVLWVGDPTILPAGVKVADRDIGYSLTRDGPGDARALWPAAETDADRVVAEALTMARAGGTARLGHLLAPAGVRYVAYVTRAAPEQGAHGRPDPSLDSALGRQLDLALSHSDTASTVYENEAWFARAALVPPDDTTVLVDGDDPLPAALRTESAGITGVAVSDSRTEPTGPGTLLWSEAASGGWKASASGSDLARHDAFGWTNAYDVTEQDSVRLTFDGGVAAPFWTVFVLATWTAIVLAWSRSRARLGRVEVTS